MFNFKKLKKTLNPAWAASALFATPALAASTSSNVTSLFNTILSMLQSLSVVVVTIAIIWAGYKVLFKGASVMEVAGPLLGAILIGAASYFAELLVG